MFGLYGSSGGASSGAGFGVYPSGGASSGAGFGVYASSGGASSGAAGAGFGAYASSGGGFGVYASSGAFGPACSSGAFGPAAWGSSVGWGGFSAAAPAAGGGFGGFGASSSTHFAPFSCGAPSGSFSALGRAAASVSSAGDFRGFGQQTRAVSPEVRVPVQAEEAAAAEQPPRPGSAAVAAGEYLLEEEGRAGGPAQPVRPSDSAMGRGEAADPVTPAGEDVVAGSSSPEPAFEQAASGHTASSSGSAVHLEATGETALDWALAELANELWQEQISCANIRWLFGQIALQHREPGRDAYGGSEAGAATPRAGSAAAPLGAEGSLSGRDGQGPDTLPEGSTGRPAPGRGAEPVQLGRGEELQLLRGVVWSCTHGEEAHVDNLSDHSISVLIDLDRVIQRACRENLGRIIEFAELAARLRRCPPPTQRADMAGGSQHPGQQVPGASQHLETAREQFERYIRRRRRADQTHQMDADGSGSQSVADADPSTVDAMLAKNGLISQLTTFLREERATAEQVYHILDRVSGLQRDFAGGAPADGGEVRPRRSVAGEFMPSSAGGPNDELQVFRDFIRAVTAGGPLTEYPECLSGQSRLVLDDLHAALRGIVAHIDDDVRIARGAHRLCATHSTTQMGGPRRTAGSPAEQIPSSTP